MIEQDGSAFSFVDQICAHKATHAQARHDQAWEQGIAGNG
jgi:hypothetical protein